MLRGPRQLSLWFPSGWGGRRTGAGRKPGPRPPTPHRARPEHRAMHPVHVTMRSALCSLRTQFVFPTVRNAIAAANRRDEAAFRIVHFSVQADHVHLLVEAANKRALSGGMRGLAVRVARGVNALVSRRGRFWADRWHGRALTSPRATRHALRYVIANYRKHHPSACAGVDPFSSGPYFTGFREYPRQMPIRMSARVVPRALAPPEPPVVRPSTWLLRAGWRRSGPLSVHDAPQSSRSPERRSINR
jgi:REP element-mobilizing transposase RayT